MNRFHVHLNVADLAASIRFYTELFGAEPTVRKTDYAKWMLEDPRVNFAISDTGRAPGIDHLGIQAESSDALAAIGAKATTMTRSLSATWLRVNCGSPSHRSLHTNTIAVHGAAASRISPATYESS